MDYPIWDVPYLGGSMIIAIISIVHVYIAQFAVGAGIFNALTESFSLKHDDGTLRQFLRDNSKFIILLPFIGGVVTGVGIWFSIALVSPEATGTLIHLFLWGWAIEWVFFLLEIAAGYVYFYGWDRMSAKAHCAVGWVYAIAAFMSLVVINGILSFMLTPGGSLDSPVKPMEFNFWAGVFNPSYFPSLIMRTVVCLALPALFAMLLVNVCKGYDQEQKNKVIQHAARYLLPLAVLVPAAGWFFATVPDTAFYYVKGGAIAMVMLMAFAAVSLALLALYSYIAIIWRKGTVSLETTALLMALALIAGGAGEFVREGMRKPFLIWGHAYSNGIVRADIPAMRDKINAMPRDDKTALIFCPWRVVPSEGGLDAEAVQAAYVSGDFSLFNEVKDVVRGKWLFKSQCARCHCIEGYNGILPLVKNWSPAMLNRALQELDQVKAFMPPFVGSGRDRQDLAQYMHNLQGGCTRCHDNVDDEGNLLDAEKKITIKADWEPEI